MKKYPDKTTLRAKFIQPPNGSLYPKPIKYEHRMVRIGNNHLNNRRLIEYANYPSNIFHE